MKKLLLIGLLLFPVVALAQGWVILNSGEIADSGVPVAVKFIKIATAGADADAVVAAVAGKKIRALGYTLHCDVAGNITWEDSDGTDVSGAMAFGTNTAIFAAASSLGYFETPAGKGLSLLKSTVTNCNGHLTYAEVD